MPFLLQPGLAYKPAFGVSLADHRRKLQAYLWHKSGGVCALCGNPIEPAQIHADHIVPRTRGGTDGVDNLQAAHQQCNSRKNNRHNDEAIAWIRNNVPYKSKRRRMPHPAPMPQTVARTYNPERFLVLAEAAELLGVPQREVKVTLRGSGVAFYHFGPHGRQLRIEREDLDRFLEKRRDAT